MARFSRESEAQLATLHPVLRATLRFAIEFVDFKVLEGHRNEGRQNALFADNKTKVRWPDSKHNSTPSLAVDIAPYPVDWSDNERFYYVCGFIMGVGSLFLKAIGLDQKYAFRYGGDWNRDGEIRNNSFNDLGHIELVVLNA